MMLTVIMVMMRMMLMMVRAWIMTRLTNDDDNDEADDDDKTIMFIVMIIQNKQVAGILSEGKPDTSLQSRLAKYWHHMAIFVVAIITLFSMVQRLFLGMGAFAAIKTLLIIGLYFLFDWLLRFVMNVTFGIVRQSDNRHANFTRRNHHLNVYRHCLNSLEGHCLNA